MTGVVEALDADGGMTCLTGAGGKKTTLYALADRLERAVLTATVRIPLFDAQVADLRVTDAPVDALRDAGEWPLGLVPAREGDRYRGYDPAAVTAVAASHDGPVLVKADGARTRLLKAPGEHEPVVPTTADTVVPVASARAVGKPLTDEHVHRPERVASLTGRDVGETIRPTDVATLLAHREGARKGVPPEADLIPLLNMVDDEDLAAAACDIGRKVLERAPVERVVLARMNVPEVVDTLD